ncbi:phosphoglucosamine mutase [Nautilia profundicola AmH]|uniref:Phosphoglucosamine mutase n=1 Tax=Nautilia profundicola (strain ATCC BAA-1463 / DSM 18972 / AmH) TaxID=598659 RepID=GLMM_NAUPA|nr:phosphoglucosamine mutase [Nautilia profundicola]B9L5Z7.1 RecName: Full=Phosphoglucosamine mutase [Nautilia profundicola AmH]ACM93177.1 phosphoglucosamine mutase [Nautilia profundicola AmH]
MKLFGTDGVRGKAGEFLTPFLAMKLAMSFGECLPKKTGKILVGKDTRRSGYMIENALVSGLTAIGYDVIQIGPMPTPAIAFLTEDMRCDGGIMISASHNPYYDNGIKFFDSFGNKLSQEFEEKIEKRYFENNFNLKTEKEIGKSKRIDDVIGRYIVHIKSSFPKHVNLNGMRIVLDTANGAAYKVAPTIFTELGADVITINDEPDGFNINQNAGAMHPEFLAKKVLEYRADIGFALDGDADRLVVVDEKGEIVNGDKLLGALAYYLHKQNKLKNNGVAVTVMSNGALEKFLNDMGIKVYRSNVGDKYVLEVMKEKDLNFGGEQSGHIIFSDYAKTGDGLVSALQAVAYLIQSGKKASEAFDLFELYPQIQANIQVSSKPPLNEIEGAKELLDEVEKEGYRHLVRYSGTENKLRLLVEGESENKAKELLVKLKEFFKSKLS